ncbi:MAG: pyridoxal-phosphate dependent enzyme [Thiolinea sp.]
MSTENASITDPDNYQQTIERFKAASIRLPKIAELADPRTIDADLRTALNDVDPDAPDPRNLFRVHWHNDSTRRGFTEIPEHIVLPSELTGVDAKIVVALGNRFPMIRAHKVLAAYGCLVPRLISGSFNLDKNCAVWPSTGNYCRGGVAISRILGCRSAAVLPEGMSRERFSWLEEWVLNPEDIVRTYGTESNVKEIYDACHQLAQDPDNVILNQFNEFGNYIVHRGVTGPALERVFNALNSDGTLNAHAFVSATGSAGTIAAGDYLKGTLGMDICAVEATQCPTLLSNGYGEHNIQGIGDKHVPFIHNVLNTDYAIGVSDEATDSINLLYNTEAGQAFLSKRLGLDETTLKGIQNLGLSSQANVLGAIKYAKYNQLSSNDVVMTVATSGAEMYGSEREKALTNRFNGNFDELAAAEVFGRYLLGAATDNMVEMTRQDRQRMFNLGYYTWVEQQGVSVEDFDARRDQGFWDALMDNVPVWDEMITKFNAAVG